MSKELAYSFHLGSDKNKSKLAKKVSKENVSGGTSLSNNEVANNVRRKVKTLDEIANLKDRKKNDTRF